MLDDQDKGPRFVRACERSKLREGAGRPVILGLTRVALFLIKGEVFALRNACPHAGASLGMGEVQGMVVACPRHDWRFNLKTGACLTNKMFCAKTYPVELRGDEVWVGLPAEQEP